jgi:hypothetical protein
MSGTNVNPKRLDFNVETRRKLIHKIFGTGVHGGEGCQDESGDTTRKDNATLAFVRIEFLDKVMSNVDTANWEEDRASVGGDEEERSDEAAGEEELSVVPKFAVLTVTGEAFPDFTFNLCQDSR